MTRTLLVHACALAAQLVGCGAGYHLSIKNETGAPLFHAPVVTDPPPPHRVVSGTSVATGTRVEIDTDDFNPVFYEKASKLGVAVQIDWQSEPTMLLVRVLQYVVPPGEEGNDPAKQPTKLSEVEFEVDTSSPKKNVQIQAGPLSQQIPIAIQQL